MKERLLWLVVALLAGFVGSTSSQAQVNLLENGNFETGAVAPWISYGDTTLAVVKELTDASIPDNPIEGEYCLHVTVNSAAANFWDIGIKHAGHVFQAGKKYTLSAFLKTSDGTRQINFKPEIDGAPYTGYGEQTITINSEWQEYHVTTGVLASNVDPASITFHLGFSAVDFWMDDVKWYEGDYVPSIRGQATVPNPKNGAKGVLLDKVLSWKTGRDLTNPQVPNPAITGHYLWLSPAFDPANPPSPNGWWNSPGVQTILIDQGNVGDTGSYAPPGGLQVDGFYYWLVDESLGASGPSDIDKLILGDTWSFKTKTSGPEVDSGSSFVGWLEAGSATIDLAGTVEDLSNNLTSIQWSVLASPAGSTVSIANPSAAVTTVIVDRIGRYVLELHAVDATQQEDSEMMEINIYANSCEAAQNHPDGYTGPAYDYNNDCLVNLMDFAMFAAGWLDDESLKTYGKYEADTIFLPPFVEFTNPLNGATVSGQIIVNAIAYDQAVGNNDGDGMEGDGGIDFQMINSSGTVLGSQHENTAAFDWTLNTASGTYPNGVYTLRVIALSDAGYETVKDISITVSNP